MRRLIDANELITALYHYEHEDGEIDAYTAQDIINSAPSIDIVRCKECRNLYIDTSDEGTSCYWCGVWANATDEDSFCSHGKRKTEPSDSEKTNNCEPNICDFCRYYNSNIPYGSTPSACKEADKFAKEFVDGLKKLKPKIEPQTEMPEYAPWRDAFDGMDCCSREVQNDNGNDVD